MVTRLLMHLDMLVSEMHRLVLATAKQEPFQNIKSHDADRHGLDRYRKLLISRNLQF